MAVNLTESEWRVKLNPEQFRILREKGTERAGTGMPTIILIYNYIIHLLVIHNNKHYFAL